MELVACNRCNNKVIDFPLYIQSCNVLCKNCYNPEESYHTLQLYEQLMKSLLFPCQFNGCQKLIAWKYLKAHEENCENRPIPCGCCAFTSENKSSLIHHYKNTHIISDTQNFIVQYIKTCFIFETLDQIFLLYIIPNTEYGGSEEASLTIRLESSIRSQEIHSFRINFYNQEEVRCLEGKQNAALTIPVNPKLKFNCFIQIYETNALKILPEIEEHVACPVCFEIMIPPISFCNNGHSICCRCKNKITQCPLCKKNFSLVRNYTLENLINGLQILKKCKYVDCSESLHISKVDGHEKECRYRDLICPIKYCKSVISYNSINNHVIKKHKQLFDGQALQTIRPTKTPCNLYKLDNNIFEIKKKFHENSRILIITISDITQANLTFVVDIQFLELKIKRNFIETVKIKIPLKMVENELNFKFGINYLSKKMCLIPI